MEKKANKKEKFNFMKWLRDFRRAKYEEWKKDPLGYEKKEKEDDEKYYQEYLRWKKEGKAV